MGQSIGVEDAIVVAHSHTITDPGHTHDITFQNTLAGGGGSPDMGGNSSFKTTTSATTGISVNSTGSIS